MITGVLFGVLAKLPINYLRAPFNTPEREMARELIQELGPRDLTRIMMLEAAQQHTQPLENLETKAALIAVARYLDRFFMAETLEQCQDLCRRGLAEISWRTYRPRPGRKFPRRSKSRHGKWANKWA